MTEELVLGDRYRLLVQLGAGGMGEVWRGVDELLQRPVAVKLIRPNRVESNEVLARFRREARVTARLAGHPNVVILYDFGQDEGRSGVVFTVMELVAGRPLAEVLRESGPMPVERASDLVWQAAAGLGAAHAAGVVHRDVKPGNLMVVREGSGIRTVKVVDFGIAAFTEAATRSQRITQTGQVIGTPLYMPPEQVRGEYPGQAGDLYALGAILYELLAGQPPFWSESPLAVLRMHLAVQPRPVAELRPELPHELSELVSALLAKEPADRPADADEIRARLAHLLPARSSPSVGPVLPATREDTQEQEEEAAAPEPVPKEPEELAPEPDAAQLRERVDRARAKSEAGRFVEAAAELGDLWPRVAAALGPDHPDTLLTRRREAYAAGKGGDHRGAADRFNALLMDMTRVYGTQHPETLAVRYYLATNAGKAGNHTLAARVHADLVPDLTVVYGPDSQRVLTTRLYLAFDTGESGNPEGAVALLADLVPDLTRVLGPDQTATLRARQYEAAYRGFAGRPAEAARGYAALLEDYARVYGAHGADTERMRDHLRQWQERARV